MTLHNAFAVKYNTTVIAGLTQLDMQANPTVESDSVTGTPYPQFAVITRQDPRIMFATRNVAAVLAQTGLVGALIAAETTMIGYFARLGANGLAASGSVHRSYTANRGLLVPRRLQVSAQSHATLDVEAVLYSSDGATHPLVIADNVALPSITPSKVLHALGPIVLGIDETTIEPGCIQQLSIDFGHGVTPVPCGSNLYSPGLETPRIAPVVTITALASALFGGTGGVPAVGQALEHDVTTIYLRKRDETGVGFVVNETTEHIKLTVDGTAVVTQHTGQGTSRAEVTLQITTKWDGTNAPLTIDTASAIT